MHTTPRFYYYYCFISDSSNLKLNESSFLKETKIAIRIVFSLVIYYAPQFTLRKCSSQIKSRLYIRRYAEACHKFAVARLRVIAPLQNSFFEISQRWRSTVSDLTRSWDKRVTAWPTRRTYEQKPQLSLQQSILNYCSAYIFLTICWPSTTPTKKQSIKSTCAQLLNIENFSKSKNLFCS